MEKCRQGYTHNAGRNTDRLPNNLSHRNSAAPTIIGARFIITVPIAIIPIVVYWLANRYAPALPPKPKSWA